MSRLGTIGPVARNGEATVRGLDDRFHVLYAGGCTTTAQIVQALLPQYGPSGVEFDGQHARSRSAGRGDEEFSSRHVATVRGLLDRIEVSLRGSR